MLHTGRKISARWDKSKHYFKTGTWSRSAAKLTKAVKRELKLGHCPCTYWTYSTIFLFSLHADSKKFSVYSRNQILQIQEQNVHK